MNEVTLNLIMTIAKAMRDSDLGALEEARGLISGWSMGAREYLALSLLIEQAGSAITGAAT